MPRDWERIRASRTDITDWVIHWTRWQNIEGVHQTAFQVLQCILVCGYLRPSFAPRSRMTMRGEQSNTIQGPYPAVCFTDQPLASFIESCRTLRSRYFPYGVSFEKKNLFRYGGRPVMYGDENLLNRLSDDDKYLWVRYDPLPSQLFGNYPIDWTHEREWRSKIQRYAHLDWGLTPNEGIPLILPPTHDGEQFLISLPRILVQTKQEAIALRHWIAGLPQYNGENGFIRQLYLYFDQIPIIPLDFVSERLTAGDIKWSRLETLPYSEIRLES